MIKSISKSFCSCITLLFILFGFSMLFLFSCNKGVDKIQPNFTIDSIMDVDSNYYRIVKIGEQWWMAQNLKTTKYRDGSSIIEAESNTEWLRDTASYCVFKNDNKSPGFLYNWYAVNDPRKIAPEGWHVATDADWKVLEISLGMDFSEVNKAGWRGEEEARKLKIEDRKGWVVEPETWPNNKSGFNALAGGARLFNGLWADPGLFSVGFWWTATGTVSNKAFYRHLDYKSNQIFRDSTSALNGYNVRCVKD
jgi:uncharacterized protein (TIGR02145 family)